MRYLFPALLLICALLLCACASPSVISRLHNPASVSGSVTLPEAPDAQEEAPAPAEDAAEEPPEEEPFLDLAALSEPPALTLATEKDESIETFRTSYDWVESLPDGTAAAFIACGPAPLDLKEVLQAERIEDSLLRLDFSGYAAENIVVRCWEDSAESETESEAQDVSVSIENGVASFHPLPGGHIYEIFSQWETFGSSSYVVWLILPEM